MFGILRNEDGLLFKQLGRITRDLEGSATLLERLLVEPRSAADGIVREARSLAADVALHHDDVNVRAFTGFAMRLDASQYRERRFNARCPSRATDAAMSFAAGARSSTWPISAR
ncbi:MAG: hypothetical protein ACREPM_15540 [Gemmatimonadaceae bacterium]